MTLIKQGKRIIQDVSTLPSIGESRYIYHNTTDGYFYNWNEITNQFNKISNTKPIYSDSISNVLADGEEEGQFLYITNTGDEFGVIDEVYVWIGGMWSPYPSGISEINKTCLYKELSSFNIIQNNDFLTDLSNWTQFNEGGAGYPPSAKSFIWLNGKAVVSQTEPSGGELTLTQSINLPAGIHTLEFKVDGIGLADLRVNGIYQGSYSGGIYTANITGGGLVDITFVNGFFADIFSIDYVNLIVAGDVSWVETFNGIIKNCDGTILYNSIDEAIADGYTLGSCCLKDEYTTIKLIDQNKTQVSVTQTNTSGNKIASISVDGNSKDLFEKVTSLSINNNIIVYTDENGASNNLDLNPILGDKYATTSATCQDISTASGDITITVGTNLSYVPLQTIVMIDANNSDNHMHADVVSYNSNTGDLVVNVKQKSGTGNICNWLINLDSFNVSATTVVVSQTNTSGNKIGSVNVNGTNTDLFEKVTSVGTLTYANNVLTVPYTDETGTVNNKTVTIATTAFKHSKEWHVDKNGNDTTGTGAEDNPFLTVAKALTLAGSTGEKVVVHAGTYAENITVTQLNLDIVGENGTRSGTSYIQGTITISGSGASSSVRVANIMLDNLVHTGSVRLITNEANIRTAFTKSGTGSVNSYDSSLVGVSITGAGQTTFFGGETTGLTINNANAIVTVTNGLTLASATVTSGVLGINNTPTFAITSGGTAISSSIGTTVLIRNTSIYDSVGVLAKVSLLGNYSIEDVYFNKTTSTLGTNINQIDWFNNIGLINVPTITTATKALVRDANGIVSEQLFPNGGGAWTTATTNPTATGNTGTLPRFVENTVNGSKWYIDSTGAAKIIELSTVSALRVFVNDLPAVATIFSLENPPVTNDNALKNLDNAEYIVVSADPLKNGLSYSSNGTTYTAYTIPDKTPWILGGTASTDAGADKTNSIYRKGRVLIATNGSTQTTPLKDLHLQNGGASLLTSAFGSGQIFSTNDSSGPRFFLEHLGAGNNLKTSVMYTQNGITYLGAIVSDNGSTWIFANPLNINHSTGFVGVRTTTPLSNLEVNGSFGTNIISTGAATYTLISTDSTVVMTTAGAVVTLGASVNRRIVNIKNGSTGNITFTGHIDNVASATLTIPSGQSRTLHGNGTTWWII